MLIVDRGANKIRKVIPGGSISTFAGSGTAGFSGDGWCDLATAQFNAPTGIASDFMGNIYVADTANNRVRVVDPQGCVATVAGTGVAGNAGASFARDAELNAPASVAVGTDLDIYVGDNSGRIIGIGTNNSFLVVAGTGSKGFSELGTATGTQIGRVVGMAVESGLLYFLDRDASRIRVTSVNSAAIAIKDARVSLIPGASGHAADQVLLTVSLSASISPRYPAFDVPGATGAPTILSSFGVAGSPSALMYGDAIAIDLGSEQSLRTNTAYAFVVSGVSFSSLAPHQIMVSCHDASLGVLAFGRSNIVRTDGPGNMPTVGQAGFASPVNASSTAVLSGPTKLSLDPSVTTSGSVARSFTSSGNLNGQSVSASFSPMSGATGALQMASTSGVAPSLLATNRWAIGASGGAGIGVGAFAGGHIAGTSGTTELYSGLGVGSAASIGINAKEDYLQPAGRYSSTWNFSLSRGR